MIGVLAQHYGWDAAFGFICACWFIPGVLLSTKLVKECKEYKDFDGEDSIPFISSMHSLKSSRASGTSSNKLENQI